MEQRRVPREQLLRLASEWHDPARPGSTWYLEPGSVPQGDPSVPESVVKKARRSETGAVLLWGADEGHLVLPPFPVTAETRDPGWRTDGLVDLLERRRRVGVLVVRLEGFAVGVYDGDRLVASKVEGRFVKGRHKKGGQSQKRFARRREEQARKLYEKACRVLESKLGPREDTLDHVLLGGDKITLAGFEKHCPYLEGLGDLRVGRLLNVREPKRAALEALPRQLYESRVFSFGPEEADG